MQLAVYIALFPMTWEQGNMGKQPNIDGIIGIFKRPIYIGNRL